ncbi:MAG: hypothetical protein Q8R92_01795 [Deltaproteobacteria bacterium]|nr:hypothetical protein [Deltaproteobacteria bacterium]
MLVSEMRSTMTSSMVTGTGTYGNELLDRAFRFAGHEFVRRTGCTQTNDTVVTVSGTDTIDCSSLDNFKPFRLKRAAIDDRALKIVNYNTIE